MEHKLLTKRDLAERWQISESTIDEYREKGIITAVRGLKCVRFNPQHIAEIEGTKLERFSPIERRRLERELEEVTKERDKLKNALTKIQMIALESLYKYTD